MASIKFDLYPDARPAKRARRVNSGGSDPTTSTPRRLDLLPVDGILERKLPTYDPNYLATKHPHPLDTTIRFVEKTHAYYVKWGGVEGDFDDGKSAVSTSGFVHHWFTPFNAHAVATKIVNGKNYGRGKYAGMCVDEICKMWQDSGCKARDCGTAVHFLLELHANGYDLEKEGWTKYRVVDQFLRFERDHLGEFEPYRTEFRFRSGPQHLLTGTADLLLIKKDHGPPEETDDTLHLTLADFKLSKEIKRANRWQCGNGPCKDLDDCNYVTYALQQGTYKWFLETFYGGLSYKGRVYKKTKVDAAYLYRMHDTLTDVDVVEVPDMGHVISDMLDRRAATVARQRAGLEPVPSSHHHGPTETKGQSGGGTGALVGSSAPFNLASLCE